jgi:uncharacterized membrane protein YecN with MAPEG domain
VSRGQGLRCRFWRLSNAAACREQLNEHANFETFPAALLVLVRIATNDAWAVIAEGVTMRSDRVNCIQSLGECGVPYAVSAIYFVSFVALVSMIMLNLVVSIILDNFELLQVGHISQ